LIEGRPRARERASRAAGRRPAADERGKPGSKDREHSGWVFRIGFAPLVVAAFGRRGSLVSV